MVQYIHRLLDAVRDNRIEIVPNRFGMMLLVCLLVAVTVLSCSSGGKQDMASATGSYPIHPVDLRDVKLTDRFWLPIVQRIQGKTIPYALEKCREEGRFDNFLIAGGQMEGDVRGQMPFDDTDVYKIIEGASMSLVSAPNPELEKQLDNLIEIISVGQEPDGYLTTWRTINPKKPPAPWKSGRKRSIPGAARSISMCHRQTMFLPCSN